MAHRRNNLIPFSRDYRRPPRWNMGFPARRQRLQFRDLRDPRYWLKVVILFAGFGLAVLPFLADATVATMGRTSENGCRIAKVIDGDTVLFWCSGRGLQKTRLKGFDTPEVFSPKCLSEWQAGIAATWYLRRILLSANKLAVGFAGTDRYGRALATIATDAGPISGQMIAAGYGRPYSGGERQGWCQ